MKVVNLKKSYNNKLLFENVSFDIKKGILKISGNTGCGKSTFVDIILGVIKPDEGYIVFENDNIFSCALQKNTLFSNKSLTENIKLFNLDIDFNRYQYLLDNLNFNNLVHRKIRTLSGGERKKAELIFCLIKNANTYIFDEPFASIDSSSGIFIKNEIEKLSRSKLVILINHDSDIKTNIDLDLNLSTSKITIYNKNIGDINNEISIIKPKKFLYGRNNKKDFINVIIMLIFILCFNFACSFTPRSNIKNNVNISLKYSPFDKYKTRLYSSTKPINKNFFNNNYSYYVILDNVISSYGSMNISEKYVFIENEKITTNEIIGLKDIDSDFLMLNEEKYEIKTNNEYLTLCSYQDTITNDLLKNINYKYIFFVPLNFIDKIFLNNFSSLKFENQVSNFMLLEGLNIESFFVEKINNIEINNDISDDYYFACKSEKKTLDIYKKIANNNVLIESINVTESLDEDKIIMNLKQYKDFLLHVSNINVGGLDTYGLIVNKEQYKEINKYETFTIHNHLLTNNQDTYFYEFMVLSFMVFIALIISLTFNYVSHQKDYENLYSCYIRNGIKKKEYIKDFYYDIIFKMIMFTVLSLISYYLFIKLANYINMISSFAKVDGFYYYSLEPYNSSYNYLKHPIPFNEFNTIYFISYIIFAFYIIFNVAMLKKTVNKK